MKPIAWFVLLVALRVLAPSFLEAQQSPQRDPQAMAAVQNALTVLGGSVIAQIQTSVVQGTVQAAPVSWLTSGDFTWESSGNQFRYDNPDANGRSVLISGKSGPVVTIAGKNSKLFAHIMTPLFRRI